MDRREYQKKLIREEIPVPSFGDWRRAA